MNNRKEFLKYAVGHHGMSSHTVEDYISATHGPVSGPESMTRTVIEERPMPFREVDVFSRLMADRIIFLGTGVDDYIANIIQAQLLFLESTDPGKDIQIYINSPGGSVYAGLGIYDTMQYIRPDVATICTGMAASMGAVLLCGGATGKRTGLKHSRVMIHQPLGGASGQATDVEIRANELLRWKKELTEIYEKTTGQPLDKLKADMERDKFMTPTEAVEYGLADKVISSRADDDADN